MAVFRIRGAFWVH